MRLELVSCGISAWSRENSPAHPVYAVMLELSHRGAHRRGEFLFDLRQQFLFRTSVRAWATTVLTEWHHRRYRSLPSLDELATIFDTRFSVEPPLPRTQWALEQESAAPRLATDQSYQFVVRRRFGPP